jgi:hypothetical protein
VLLAPGGSQSDKDRVWGPYSYKFQIIVKVSSGAGGRCCTGGVCADSAAAPEPANPCQVFHTVRIGLFILCAWARNRPGQSVVEAGC